MPRLTLCLNRGFVAAVTLLTTLVLIITGGCSRHDRRSLSERAGDAYESTMHSLDHTWDQVRSYSYDKRDTVVRDFSSASARTDAQIDRLQAEFAQGRANASGRAALDDLKSADADFHGKLDALSRASADGWNAAKEQAIASWHRLEAAYDRASNKAK